MRFFKYLIFIILSFVSVNVFAAFYLKSNLTGTAYPTVQAACDASFSLYALVPKKNGSTWNCIRPSDGSGITIVYEGQTKCESGRNLFLDGFITPPDGFAPDSVCSSGCIYQSDGGGTAFDTPNGNISWGINGTSTGATCSVDTPKGEDTPNNDPMKPEECKNSNGSDAYCNKPSNKQCPVGYKQGSFNNQQICIKNSTDPDPTKPNPNDPNNSGGQGNCNGTNNCNTTNFDDSGIISAINSLKSSLTSAISSMTNTLSSAISSVTSAVNSVKNSVDANTAAVNANGDKVKSAVDSNTAAVNTNGDKVKNSVDSNTAAVNANGDKVKNSVDSNTAAVNANGDKVKNSVDANTAAVNANGDKVKNSVDANTAAVKEGNGLLSDIKNWLTSTDGVKGEPGLLTIDQIEIEQQQDKFQWSAQCPAPIEKTTSIIGYSWTYSFSFDSWCSVLARLSNYFVFAATFGACLIIAGVRNG
ncbi:MAG: virulence factor TspB C-terminal domain-related protein [Anaerorhabdus sp.]|uniref:virulence factor TspB C-terminal domain-related protein n=1 Tax=Anaerorhabdus sp. TaxID=1872524 RepID=UPI002FCB5FF5